MSTTRVFKSSNMSEVKLGRIGSTVSDSRRYQKLTEVDPSIIDGDSDEDDSGGNAGYYKHAKGNEDYDFSTVKGTFTYCYHFLRYTLLGDFQVAFRYVHKNSKKNLKSLVLGLLTVFLVVLFISFLQNLIQASPIVFLKLSEDQTGELDLVLTGDPSAIVGASTNTSLTESSNGSGVKASTPASLKGNLLSSAFLRDSSSSPTPSNILSSLLNFDISSFFVNSTLVTHALENASTVHGVAPRWLSLGDIQTMSNPQMGSSLILLVMNTTLEKQLGLGRGWTLPPLQGNQVYISNAFLRRIQTPSDQNAVVNMHVDFVDVMQRLGVNAVPSQTEFQTMIANMLGEPLPDQLNVSQAMSWLNVTNPDLVVSIMELLGDAISSDGSTLYPPELVNNIYDGIRSTLVIDKELVVAGGINNPGGKYPNMLGNVAVLESEFVDTVIRERLTNISSYISQNLTLIENLLQFGLPIVDPDLNTTEIIMMLNQVSNKFTNLAHNFKLNDYSMSPVVMLENRVKVYTSSSEEMDRGMIAFSNQVSTMIGYNYPAIFTTPLFVSINLFKYTKMSLDQVFNCVAAVLLVLGALMIYSLLLSDVEGKTFEYGMLRAQGLRHYALIILLLTQAIYFSVPGILLGLLFGWFFFAIVAHFVYAFVILPVNLTYYPVSIISGVGMGFFIPIIANIAPIQRALSRTLRDALDIYHQVKNETMVKIMKLEEVGIDLLQTLLAVLSVVVGFTVYYLIPYAFTFYNFSLFFGILTAILLGMLFGLSMLAQAVQPLIEKGVLFFLVWGPDRVSLYHLVRKNLFAHSGRNAKTATMFTICLTFIIFTGCVFRLQGYNIQQLTRLSVGSDIAILASSIKDPIPEAQITAFLNDDMANNTNSIVAGYTTVTFPMNRVLNIYDTRLRTLANYPDYGVRIYGMDENFLDNTYLSFYDVTEKSSSLSFPDIRVSSLTTNKKNTPNVIESLYTNARKDKIPLDDDGTVNPPPVQSYRAPIYNNSWVDGDSPLAITYRNFNNSYIYKNYTDMVISEAFRQAFGADTDTPFNLYIKYKGKIDSFTKLTLLGKAQSMVEMFPSFLFSAYGAMAEKSPVLVSNDQFQEIMRWVVAFSNDTTVQMPQFIPKSKLLVRLKSEDASQLDREYIINGIKNFIKTDDITVIDTQSLLNLTDTAVLLLDIFFYTVSCAAIVLCFFMLWISFSANIHENSWEFGVLRAIGLTSFQVTRIYIYEALVLIFSSVILGLLIGLGVAITLTLQFDLFTQLPFSFQFPFALFFGVLSASILIAIGVSYQSSKEYRTRQIASVLKGK